MFPLSRRTGHQASQDKLAGEITEILPGQWGTKLGKLYDICKEGTIELQSTSRILSDSSPFTDITLHCL